MEQLDLALPFECHYCKESPLRPDWMVIARHIWMRLNPVGWRETKILKCPLCGATTRDTEYGGEQSPGQFDIGGWVED